MSESVLPTRYRLKVGWIVSDVAWDETVEEPVSNPSSGDESNIFEGFQRKNRDSSYFSYIHW